MRARKLASNSVCDFRFSAEGPGFPACSQLIEQLCVLRRIAHEVLIEHLNSGHAFGEVVALA